MQVVRVEDDELDVVTLLQGIWEERLIIVSGLLLAAVIAVGYLWRQTPMYLAVLDFRPQPASVFAPIEGVTPVNAANEFVAVLSLFSTFSQYFLAHPEQLGCGQGDRALPCIEGAHQRLRINASQTVSRVELVYPRGIDGPKVLNDYVDSTARNVFSEILQDHADILQAELQKNAAAIHDKRELRDETVQATLAKLKDALARAQALGIKRPRLGEITAQTGQIRLEDSLPTYLFGTDIIEQRIQSELSAKKDDLRIEGVAELRAKNGALQRRIDYLRRLKAAPAVRLSGLRTDDGRISPRYGTTLALALIAGAALGGMVAFLRSSWQHHNLR